MGMRRIFSYIRSNRRRCLITGAVGLLAVGGGIGIGALTSGSSTGIQTASATSPTTISPTSNAPAANGASSNATGSGVTAKATHRRGVRGTITAIDGDTWTVQTAAGRSVTVTINSSTKYGPQVTPGSLVVGSKVVVIGPRVGTTITAVHVGLGRSAGATQTTPTTEPSSGSPA